MRALFAQASTLTDDVIGAAMELHDDKRPGSSALNDGVVPDNIHELKLTEGISRRIIPDANLH
jgi:hypothetical protein